jgi:hypothetical protein
VCGNIPVEQNITRGQHLKATVWACQQFIELFDKHKNALLGDIKSTFGF